MKKFIYILFPIVLILVNCSSDDNAISDIAENLDTISENGILKNNDIKRVLVLNSFHEGYHWTDRIMTGIKSTFSGNDNIELFINYLDTKRCSDSTHFEFMNNVLSNKYKKIKFDAILSTDDYALNFLIKYRDTLFPEVPVIFCGINDYEPKRIEDHPFFTGIYELYDVKGTVDLILSLHPNTNKIVVISDATHSGDDFKGKVERAETSFEGILSFEYLTNLSPELLSSKLGDINKETVVIWTTYIRKPDGVSMSCEESVRFITESTKQPAYCVWDVVGQGVVGGKITDPAYQGERAAEIILDIFNGLKVTDIPVENSPTVYKFDYNALQRFNISESKLPKESLIINKLFSFYQTYKTTIFLISGLIVFLIIIVIILLRLNRIQRNAKIEIAKKNEELKEASNFLHENNINLLKAKEKAEESDKLKTAFLNNISHEIRTPLNGILGFAPFIIQPDITMDEKEKYLEVINMSSYRLINTVNDIMDISMIISGSIKVHPNSVVISSILTGVYEQFQGQCKKLNLEINLQLPANADQIVLNTDKELLGKAVFQLMDNSVKFTKQGSITIGMELFNNEIKIFIKDTGKGIEKDAQEVIFENFMQENISNTRGHEGSGLGLSIAKGMMQLLGGKIYLESIVNIGTTVFLSLPNIPTIVEVEPEIVTKTIPKAEKPLILIAEDDDVNYEYVAILLRNSYKTLRACNGKEAVELIKTHPDINLVLMDIKMPVMGGVEATQLIKSLQEDLPVIAVTAHAQIGDEFEFKAAGCDDYISKPIKADELKQIIKKYLNKN